MKMMMCAAAMAATLYAYPAHAQQWSSQQTDVWQSVSSMWEAHVDAGDWHRSMTDDSYGWGGGSGSHTLPRSRAQYEASARVFGAEGEVLHYELTPLAISVRGDTAMAHYMAVITETDHKGDRETVTERCSDTLVRENGRWMFLGWGCAQLGD